MAAEADQAELCVSIQEGLAQLKSWIDNRLQQQDELLRCIYHECHVLARQENGFIMRGQETLRTTALAETVSHLPSVASLEVKPQPVASLEVKPPSKESLEVLPLPGSLIESSANFMFGTSLDDQEILSEISEDAHKGQDWQIVLVDFFDYLDADHSGSISLVELKEAFRHADINDVDPLKLFKADRTGDGSIDRVEWLHLIEDAAQSDNEEMILLRGSLDQLAAVLHTKGDLFWRDRRGKPFLILRHDSPWRMAWDLLLCILLFYVSITVPFTLGFGESKLLDHIGLAIDILFCCDVVLNFRTSFINREGCTIIDGRRIAMNYLKTWFLLDFISSVPFDAITAGLLPNLSPARLLKIGKIAKVMKLLRISQTITNASESEFLESVDHFLTSRSYQSYVRLVNLVLVMLVAAHWLACFGSAIDTSHIDVYFADEMEAPSRMKKYLAGMYWSMCTLTTVGYGDVIPRTDEERAYSILAMVIGGALYGYVIGSVTSLVTEKDIRTHAYHQEMELVYSWLDCHCGIPSTLRRCVRKYFKRSLATKSVMEDCAIVRGISPELRADIAFFIVHERVRSHPMFLKHTHSALAKLVEVLNTVHISPQERVVRVGDPGTAMYILVDGLARYEQGVEWFPQGMEVTGKGTRFDQVAEGGSFGEEIIFHMMETYCYTVGTLKVCDFQSISEDDFKSKYKNMPELREEMYHAFLKNKRQRALDTTALTKKFRNGRSVSQVWGS